jgi:hypothetical protein
LSGTHDLKTFPIGTPVHVEFDGQIYRDYSPDKTNLNHVVVTDGNFLHHVHRNSPNVTVQAPKRVIADGQIWRAGGENFIRMDGKFESAENLFYDRGIDSREGENFFDEYPDAQLVMNPDGTLV